MYFRIMEFVRGVFSHSHIIHVVACISDIKELTSGVFSESHIPHTMACISDIRKLMRGLFSQPNTPCCGMYFRIIEFMSGVSSHSHIPHAVARLSDQYIQTDDIFFYHRDHKVAFLQSNITQSMRIPSEKRTKRNKIVAWQWWF